MEDGFVSANMPRTKRVPNSGTPSVPVPTPKSSAVMPNAAGDVNSERIFPKISGSFKGTSCGLIPVKSCKRRSMVGSSCPSTSNFTSTSCIELKSKCVVIVSVFISSAGCCTAVN